MSKDYIFSTSKGGMQSKLYEANMILSLSHKNELIVLKNRYSGVSGVLSIDEAVAVIAKMLASHIFQGSMDMFQTTMQMKLIERMTEVVSGRDIIPKGDIKNENPI